MTERSFRRTFEVLDLPPGELQKTASMTGSTLNDVFVASVTRGLKRYHELHGRAASSLRALMPVNVRRDDSTLGGNHFVPARFLVPTGPDAAACVGEVHRITGEWKHASGLGVSEMMASALSLLPAPVTTALWGSMLKGDDFCVTNVPGPSFEAFTAGARVERIYAFAPPSGAALNVSLVTVSGRDCVGMNIDSVAVPDGAKLAACLEEGFGEVLELGRVVEVCPSL
jgi:hypothetical protein